MGIPLLEEALAQTGFRSYEKSAILQGVRNLLDADDTWHVSSARFSEDESRFIVTLRRPARDGESLSYNLKAKDGTRIAVEYLTYRV